MANVRIPLLTHGVGFDYKYTDTSRKKEKKTSTATIQLLTDSKEGTVFTSEDIRVSWSKYLELNDLRMMSCVNKSLRNYYNTSVDILSVQIYACKKIMNSLFEQIRRSNPIAEANNIVAQALNVNVNIFSMLFGDHQGKTYSRH